MSRSLRVLPRVVSVCRTLPTPADPAAGTFVAARLRAMARATSVRVLQPVPYCPPLAPLPAWARGPAHSGCGLAIEPAPMYYLPGVMKRLDAWWLARSIRARVSALHRAGNAELLDAHFGYPDGAGCAQVARQLGLPYFITVRGFETDFLREPARGSQLLRALRGAAGVISVSHSLRSMLAGHGLDPAAVRVIPNAVDRQLFSPGSRSQARQQLGVPDTAPLIVSVGHLVAGKRHHVLVRAVQRLRADHSAIQLAIVGGPGHERSYPAELQGLVRELGLASQVRILGRVAQSVARDWLRAADVFALGTAREGCCNAVLEALAVGLPVVTTPVGDNPQYVHEGRNGALVPVDDVDALAAALHSTLTRSWDAQAISGALQVGDWDRVAGTVLDYFAERLAEGPRAGMAVAHG